MNHNTDGGWKMWLSIILCCITMIGALLLIGDGRTDAPARDLTLRVCPTKPNMTEGGQYGSRFNTGARERSVAA